MEPLTTIQKAKVAYELAALLENKDLKEMFLMMPSGEAGYELLTEAIERRLEALMGNQKELEQSVSAASEEIAGMVGNIRELQQALVDMVQKVMGRPQAVAPRPRAPTRGGIIPIEPPADMRLPGGEPLDMPTDFIG